jgi:hypothetical protein
MLSLSLNPTKNRDKERIGDRISLRILVHHAIAFPYKKPCSVTPFELQNASLLTFTTAAIANTKQGRLSSVVGSGGVTEALGATPPLSLEGSPPERASTGAKHGQEEGVIMTPPRHHPKTRGALGKNPHHPRFVLGFLVSRTDPEAHPPLLQRVAAKALLWPLYAGASQKGEVLSHPLLDLRSRLEVKIPLHVFRSEPQIFGSMIRFNESHGPVLRDPVDSVHRTIDPVYTMSIEK